MTHWAWFLARGEERLPKLRTLDFTDGGTSLSGRG